MLVLTRRTGESVTLSIKQEEGKPPIEIEVAALGIDQGQIKLGFKAPQTVNVVRTELLPPHPR